MNKLLLLILAIILITDCALFSQDKGEVLDQPPAHLRGKVSLYSPTAVVTSSEGFDNFYLGVDFSEPHISTNPNNVLRFFTAFNTNATHYTLNGYDYFTNNPTLALPAGDPVTAYDSLGNLFYMNMTGTTITGCYVVKSTDNGQTWQTPVFAISGNDKNWIAADQTSGPYKNYVYCTMTAGGGNGNFSRSIDGGSTFQTTFTPTTQSLPGMMVCVGPNKNGATDIPGGCVYVVTNSGNVFSAYYSFYKSTDGGATFSLVNQSQFSGYLGQYVSPRFSVQNMRTRPYPFIAADNSYGTYRGRLYLIYATNNPAGDNNKSDIYCRYSTNQGTTWSSPIVVNDDPNSQNNYQWMPSVWCDKETGRFYVKWFDTRNCPTSDSAEVYASYSTDGGSTFVTNQKISTKKFRINCTTCGGGGTPMYLGDYDAITSNSKTSMLVWSDFRNGDFGSYTAYFPDYAMLATPTSSMLVGTDSTFITVKVPQVKLYTDKVKFTMALDSNPTSGTINLSFVNGKDSITSYPDSVRVRVKTTGTVNARLFKLTITGAGSNGTPVHKRVIDLLVNSTYCDIGTNRSSIVTFKVNGTSFTSNQRFVFPIGTTLNVAAVSPYTAGGTQYVYTNWSDGGDTTHNVTVTPNLNLMAYYKIQYKLVISSAQASTFGGNIFYDSAATMQFGVTSRRVVNSGTTYYYRGFTGSGPYSYTSADSSGIDSAITYSLRGPIVEICRWTTTSGISKISSEIPGEYKLHNNYPNPFNPSTKIKFDIPKMSATRLVIYDILGKEVAVLLSQNLEPGFYELEWNAEGLSSGVYFYKIESENFTQVKRMLLTK